MIQDLNYGSTAAADSTAFSGPILSHNFPQLIHSDVKDVLR